MITIGLQIPVKKNALDPGVGSEGGEAVLDGSRRDDMYLVLGKAGEQRARGTAGRGSSCSSSSMIKARRARAPIGLFMACLPLERSRPPPAARLRFEARAEDFSRH